jgi:hypothetical protein
MVCKLDYSGKFKDRAGEKSRQIMEFDKSTVKERPHKWTSIAY